MSEELNESKNAETSPDVAPPLYFLSDPCDKLAAALVAAQAEFTNPVKDEKVQAGSYSYKYADLAGILAMLRPTLSKHGLALLQSPIILGNAPSVVTTVLHTSGQRLVTRLDLPVNLSLQGRDAAKEVGSAITYLRRYALPFAVASEKDTDAENITGEARPVPRPVAAQPKPALRPVPAKPSTPVPEAWPGQAKFLEDCRSEYKRLGKSTFYASLGSFGFERPEDVPDRAKARKVFDDLFERVSPTAIGTVTNAHGVVIDDDDLPAELGGRA